MKTKALLGNLISEIPRSSLSRHMIEATDEAARAKRCSHQF